MAVYFEGTSTKNTYKAGEKFATSRGVVEAQKDGSFRNVETGQISRGSSQSPTANFYATGSDIALFTGGGRGDSQIKAAQKAAMGLTAAGSGGAARDQAPKLIEGTPAVRIVNPTLAAMWASRGAYSRTNAWSGKDDPAQDNLMGGRHWQASPYWTNAELFEARYGEVGETLIGLAVLGADIGWNARRLVWGENHQSVNVWNSLAETVERGIKHQADPKTFGDNLDAFGGWVSDIRGWAEQNKARERQMQAWEDEFNAAWDARESYQKAEWDRIHTPQNGPHYEERLAPNVWGY